MKIEEVRNTKEELSSEYLLDCAEYYVYEARTCHNIPLNTLEQMAALRDTYSNMKPTYKDMPQNHKKVVDNTFETLCKVDSVLSEIMINNLQIRDDLLTQAQEVYQLAINAVKSPDELEKCIKSIGTYLRDEEWANQLGSDIL